MKVNYDESTDTLTVILRNVPVVQSDEEKRGIILHYDDAGDVVSIEVLDSKYSTSSDACRARTSRSSSSRWLPRAARDPEFGRP